MFHIFLLFSFERGKKSGRWYQQQQPPPRAEGGLGQQTLFAGPAVRSAGNKERERGEGGNICTRPGVRMVERILTQRGF